MSPRLSDHPHTTGTAFEPMVATQEHGGPVTKPYGFPDGAAHSARRAGSNSTEEAEYGECRHCDRSFLLRRGDVVPIHHAPMVSERGPHPICPGSRTTPASYMEA